MKNAQLLSGIGAKMVEKLEYILFLLPVPQKDGHIKAKYRERKIFLLL